MGKTDPYRSCVVGVFRNADGKFLLGKRVGFEDSEVWQFPQGGIEEGEDPKTALYREMQEEIGNKNFTVLAESKEWIYYDFPKSLKAPIAKKYPGQKQIWFFCRYNDGEHPDLKLASDQEFSELAWHSLEFCLEEVISWKKEAYLLGLKSLALL